MDHEMETDSKSFSGPQRESTGVVNGDFTWEGVRVKEDPDLGTPKKNANYPTISPDAVDPVEYTPMYSDFGNCAPGTGPGSCSHSQLEAVQNPGLNPELASGMIYFSGITQPPAYEEKTVHPGGADGELNMAQGPHSSIYHKRWEYGGDFDMTELGGLTSGLYQPSVPLMDEVRPTNGSLIPPYAGGERWGQNGIFGSFPSPNRFATSLELGLGFAAWQSSHVTSGEFGLPTPGGGDLDLSSCNPRSSQTLLPSVFGFGRGTGGIGDEKEKWTVPWNPVDPVRTTSYESVQQASASLADLALSDLDKLRPGTSSDHHEAEGMIMNHEPKLQHPDESPVAQSPTYRPPRSSGDTEFLTSSSGAKLFQLMDIREDRQDLSFVEKIILPRGQIVSFCQVLDAESAKESRGGELSLSFEKLDSCSLNVVGFYGSKDLLVECLRSYNTIALDDPVYAKMQDDSLFPGLYALLALPERTLYVFYWYQGKSLPSASRKDISCNFVRYLVDLCDSVFILVDGSQETVRECLRKGKSSQTVRPIRQRELRIEKKQATEDAVEFLPGFSLQLKVVQATTGDSKQFKLCEGSRCGIFSHMTVPHRKFLRRKEVKVCLQEVSTGGQLFSGRSVNFKGLEAEELSLFLQCSGCSVGKEYISFLENLEQKRDEFTRRIEKDREQRLLKYGEEVQEAITDFISEYLKEAQEFSWEEALLKDTSVEVLQGMLCSVDDSVRGGDSQNNKENFLKRGAKKLLGNLWRNTTELQDSLFDNRDRLAHLDTLEARIFTGFGKFTEAPHRFIYQNNRVTVHPRSYRDPNPQVYTVEYAPNENGCVRGRHNPSGPLCFHDALVLRPVEPGPTEQIQQIIFSENDKSYGGPLLTNLQILDGSSGCMGVHYELKVVEDVYAFGGLGSWVASEAARVLPKLGRKASLLSFITSAYGEAYGPLQDKFSKRVLTQSDTEFLEDLVRDQSQGVADEVKARWSETCTSGGATHFLLEDILRQCKAVYTEARQELLSAFQVWFKMHMSRLFEKWIQDEDEEEKKVFEEGLEKDRVTHLENLRQSQTQTGDQCGIKLRSCCTDFRVGLGKPSNLIISKSLANPVFRKSTLVVGYDEEAAEFETQKWLVQEISPSKHDLDEVEKDPNHSFSPRLHEPKEILTLDPSSERLLTFALLKTGQYLAFVLTTKTDAHQLLIYLISAPRRKVPVHTCKQGYDLVAFDDQTRFLALDDQERKLIRLYRFEEAYKQLDFCGVEVDLREVGVSNLTWMKFIPGRAELVFVDSMHKVRVFDMAVRQLRPSDIQLPGPFLKAEVTRQGPCLLVFSEPTTRSEHDDGQGSVAATPMKEVEVYRIDHTMVHVNTVVIPSAFQVGTLLNMQLETAVRSFGSQEHILFLVGNEHQRIVSHCLKITSASEVYQLSSDRASTIKGQQQFGTGLPLDYLFHVYEKFSTNPPVVNQQRALSFFVVLRSGDQQLKDECVNSVQSTFYKLESEKGKNFHRLQKRCHTHELSEVPQVLADIGHSVTDEKQSIWRSVRSMGGWIRQLLCLVPLQIARAQNNCLRPLADGLELSADVDYDNTVSLATLLRFGFYDAVFASWRNKPVKIISSMGKQSTGYLLNHLSGSLLDVSGGRCTDGVWMTVRFDEGSGENACMYVLLDFEGVGTFERSEQEDMLLSVLNAAISNITIYNTKEFNLDRETEIVFDRFQSGVSLVKADDKLFKGIFHFAIKDVGEEAVDELDHELSMKIRQMLANSKENFLTTMYGGRVILALMAPFSTANFYADIDQMYGSIASPQLPPSYMDGRSFSTDLKLLIAQISAQEWAPIDSKRIELRVHLLRTHLNSAVSLGHLDIKSHEGILVNFDSHEEITDYALQFDGKVFSGNDTGLKLKPGEGDSIGPVLANLKEMFQEMVPRDGQNDETWHTAFVGFVEGVVNRRKQRVLEWISSNVRSFQQQDDIERLTLEVVTMCSELMQHLSVCSCTCEKCFFRCVREKVHVDGHSCLGDHFCTRSCSFCVAEKEDAAEEVVVNKCSDAAGHQGSHNCRIKSHTCSKACEYDGIAANCNKICAGMVGHEGRHRCNSREHKCAERCSLRSCNNPCITPFEITDHPRHVCHEKFCPLPCSMKGCNRRCESKDHFHDETPNVIHSCGLPHPCLEKCEVRGNCAVQQDLVKTMKTFRNKFGSFEYEHVAEQTGVRKSCCIEIPPFHTKHEGPHLHSVKENIVHFCDIKCPACGYFCTEPIDHPGLHNTVHGNMRGTTFSAESEKIELEDRKYEWGDSGAAEMCNMHCKKQGRGHIHMVFCPSGQAGGGICYSRLHADGVRHETIQYGPDFDVPKDEMTHAAYWRHTQFVDPCSQEDQKLFNLCPHQCPSEEHKGNSLTGESDETGKLPKSFCTLPLWHAPVALEKKNLNRGNITIDGHHMECNHLLPSNVVFVIDRSSSMGWNDVIPQFVQFHDTLNNRLGCVFEAILRFIRTRRTMSEAGGADLASVVLFNHEDPATTVVEMEAMDESIMNKLLAYGAGGNTDFSTGLKEAARILLKAKMDHDERDPVVIFLSDGENWGSNEVAMDIIRSMHLEHGNRLKIFTVKFGHVKEKILERMAGPGQSYVSGDLQKLTDTFISLARSLRPLASSLVTKGGNERRRSNKIFFSKFV
ncbi:hypothetical protein R1sor_004215 [Riccia sorocarpa]|uniref:VWFA domain-containing protein n=1 Tax=Riccia sorocarpa TaxID=122646 RepID=A0ABD3H3V8_9MARC